MALTNPISIIIPRRNRMLGTLTLDAVLEETTSYQAAVTDHPVEVPVGAVAPRGAVVDHVFLLPRTYTMRGAVSDLPFGFQQVKATFGGITAPQSRSTAAYRLLVDLFEAREPFTIDTGYAQLESMVIEALTFPRGVENSTAILFSASLREVQLARSSPVVARIAAQPETTVGEQAQTQAVSEVKRGRVAPKEITAGAKAYDYVKGLLGGGAP